MNMLQEMQKAKFDIREGTVSFWTRPNQITFSDESVVPLVNLNSTEGSILILKDSDSRIKFFHVYLGKGRTDAEVAVNELDSSAKHMFVFTWSVEEGQIKIYVDGKPRIESKIEYAAKVDSQLE